MQIDWSTLALQTINVLILAWILARFFYRPVAAIIEKRRAEAKKMLADADDAKKAAEKTKAEIEETRKGIASEREGVLASAHKDAEAARASLLDEARAAAKKATAQAQAEWRREQAELESALDEKAGVLAVDIARRLLARLPAEAANDAFVESLCGELKKLPEKTRTLIISATARGAPFEIASAAPLTEAQKKRCSEALNTIAGHEAALTFKENPSLIAGIELKGPEIALTNSWRNDLDDILKELKPSAEAHAAS